MTSQLTLYNGALRLLGQPKLTALTDTIEPRRLLDGAWDENARDFCLEQASWNFALRASSIEYDSSVSPDFGFQRAFVKPSDWLRTYRLASDEYFLSPLTDFDFSDEQGYWWADYTTIYVSYVSNDAAYGYDLSLWPQTFVRYVEAYLAEQVAPRIDQSLEGQDKIEKRTKKALVNAMAKDALNEGAKFPPAGSWTRSRGSGWRRRDWGSRRRLTG